MRPIWQASTIAACRRSSVRNWLDAYRIRWQQPKRSSVMRSPLRWLHHSCVEPRPTATPDGRASRVGSSQRMNIAGVPWRRY